MGADGYGSVRQQPARAQMRGRPGRRLRAVAVASTLVDQWSEAKRRLAVPDSLCGEEAECQRPDARPQTASQRANFTGRSKARIVDAVFRHTAKERSGYVQRRD